MNYFKRFNNEFDKLLDVLDAFSLVASWRRESFPVRLIISPNASPESQMSLLGTDDGRSISPDARIVYTFGVADVDDVSVSFSDKITLPDHVVKDIGNKAKKLYALYTQGYFAALNKDNPDAPEVEIEGNLDAGDDESSETDKFDGFYEKGPEPAE